MGEVIPFPVKREPFDMGACPQCGTKTGWYNVGRVHWAVCRIHMLAWWGGEGLHPPFPDEDAHEWALNVERLKAFTIVEPLRASAPARAREPDPAA